MKPIKKYRTIIKYETSNPLVKQVSVRRLMTELNLSQDRIYRLLAADQIVIDNYNQVIVNNTRGLNKYCTTIQMLKIEIKQK